MKFELEVGDRLRTVEIERRAEGFQVTVDGRVRIVDAARVGSSSWSLLIRDADAASSRSVEATVLLQDGSTGPDTGLHARQPRVGPVSGFDVHIDGLVIPVRLKAGRGRRARDVGGHSAHGAAPQRLSAPMPGKVLRVLVRAGDEVKPRQGLVVIEAMKMENELRAVGAGRVREVLVVEGQSVDAGAALVVVE